MPSRRETALSGLVAALILNLPVGSDVRRDDGKGDQLPEPGAALVVVADGAIESDAILSPPCHDITLSAEITVSAYERADLDAALLGIADALEADPTLDGAVDGWSLGDPVVLAVAPMETQGGEPVPLPDYVAAQVAARLHYVAPTPLG